MAWLLSSRSRQTLDLPIVVDRSAVLRSVKIFQSLREIGYEFRHSVIHGFHRPKDRWRFGLEDSALAFWVGWVKT